MTENLPPSSNPSEPQPARTTRKVVTFGCRLNSYESQIIQAHLDQANSQNTIVFNTCAVTVEAERQAKQAIRRARLQNPTAQIIVTGCAAQISPEKYAALPEVNHVLGNEEKIVAKNYDEKILTKTNTPTVKVNDIMSVKQTASHLIEGFAGRTRAFVQVQNGCDHRCSFCIIPFGRGNSRSTPIDIIIQQVKNLQQNGYQEIVLTGVDLTSYGADLAGRPTLGMMVKQLLQDVPALPRLRLSSIDCIEMDDTLFDVIQHEPRFMPHLHLSLQSGDDIILKRMKRRHLRKDVISLCQKLHQIRPDIILGADLIAGFPTETDAMFEKSCTIIEDCNLTWLHIFPYSERHGTVAARIPKQIPKATRKQRAAHLRNLGQKKAFAFLQTCLNKEFDVLFERNSLGYTQHFAPVKLQNTWQNPSEGAQLHNDVGLKRVRINAIDGTVLQAEI